MAEEARQRAQMRQVLSRELSLDRRLIVVDVWRGLEAEARGALPPQLELESPDSAVRIQERWATRPQEGGVGIVGALPRLHALVVDAREDRARTKDEASERAPVVKGVPLHPRRLDEAQA